MLTDQQLEIMRYIEQEISANAERYTKALRILYEVGDDIDLDHFLMSRRSIEERMHQKILLERGESDEALMRWSRWYSVGGLPDDDDDNKLEIAAPSLHRITGGRVSLRSCKHLLTYLLTRIMELFPLVISKG